MKKIRRSVFETNSSSTHSWTIESEGNFNYSPFGTYNTLLDILFIEGQQFGWEEAEYASPKIKSVYAVIYVRDWTSGEKQERYKAVLIELLRKVYPNLKDFIVVSEWSNDGFEWYGQEQVDKLIAEMTKNGYYDYETGYIDHQSVESSDLDFMFDDPKLLENFIFNTSSILTTDNDNQ